MQRGMEKIAGRIRSEQTKVGDAQITIKNKEIDLGSE